MKIGSLAYSGHVQRICLVSHRNMVSSFGIVIIPFDFILGEDGKDFISVEHCGDDFLAALAESMEDSEEWDDLQNMESEACGDLENLFDNKVLNNDNTDNGHSKKRNINVIDGSSASLGNPNFVELDSSSDSDLDFRIPNQKDAKSTHSHFPDLSGSSFKQSLGEHCSKSLVRASFIEHCCPIVFYPRLLPLRNPILVVQMAA